MGTITYVKIGEDRTCSSESRTDKTDTVITILRLPYRDRSNKIVSAPLKSVTPDLRLPSQPQDITAPLTGTKPSCR